MAEPEKARMVANIHGKTNSTCYCRACDALGHLPGAECPKAKEQKQVHIPQQPTVASLTRGILHLGSALGHHKPGSGAWSWCCYGCLPPSWPPQVQPQPDLHQQYCEAGSVQYWAYAVWVIRYRNVRKHQDSAGSSKGQALHDVSISMCVCACLCIRCQ